MAVESGPVSHDDASTASKAASIYRPNTCMPNSVVFLRKTPTLGSTDSSRNRNSAVRADLGDEISCNSYVL